MFFYFFRPCHCEESRFTRLGFARRSWVGTTRQSSNIRHQGLLRNDFQLSNLYYRACAFKLLLCGLGLVFADALFNRFRCAVNKVLGFFESKSR
jgi:hypothetical protein